MPTVSDVLAALHRRVPASSAASWDPTGLQLGDAGAEVAAVAVCHEVTESVLERVESERPDLVITYHPLLFRPTNRLVAGRTPAGRALRLARAGVALAITHTSFDSASGGTGDALAAALGLTHLRLFGSTGPEPGAKVVTFVPAGSVEAVARAMASEGGGRIGNYSGCSFRSPGVGAFEAEVGAAPVAGDHGTNRVDEVRMEMFVSHSHIDAVIAAMISAHPYEEPAYDVYETVSNGRFIGRIGRHDGSFDDLRDRVVAILGDAGLRVSAASDRAGTVAVLPGSGSSFISAVSSAGADVLVTGDVDHHRVVAARDGGLSIVDPGHAATERPGMAALVALVRRTLPELTLVDLTADDPTPWR